MRFRIPGGLFLALLIAHSIVAAEPPAVVGPELTEPEKKADEPEKLSATFTLDFRSGYIDVNGAWLSKSAVVQADITLTFPNNIYIDLWHSAGLSSGLDSGYDDETDIYVGWTKEFENGLNLDINLAYFNLYKLDTINDDDAFQLTVEVSKDFTFGETHTIAPFIRTETLASVRTHSVKGETYLYGGFSHAWVISDAWSLEHKLYALYDPGIYELDAGFVLGYEAALGYQINKQIKWNLLTVQAFTPLSVSDERETAGVIGTGLVVEF
jgi:hypothetical protein